MTDSYELKRIADALERLERVVEWRALDHTAKKGGALGGRFVRLKEVLWPESRVPTPGRSSTYECPSCHAQVDVREARPL